MPDVTPTVSDETAQMFRRLIAIAVRHLTTIAVVMGALWIVARPHAEEFVRTTVSMEKFATQRSLETIEDRIQSLEKSSYDLRQAIEGQDRALERLNADSAFIKALQAEQRQDIKQILRGLNQLNSDRP